MREKNGYLCFSTDLIFSAEEKAKGHVYIATEENGAYLGEADELSIAREISLASGPSGPNSEYLLKLADALRSLGQHDAHVFGIETHLI